MSSGAGWPGRYRLHRERSEDFWRGYLWGHFDAAAELLLALVERQGGMSDDLKAALDVLKTRRRLIEEEKGVMGPVRLDTAHRLLTEDGEASGE